MPPLTKTFRRACQPVHCASSTCTRTSTSSTVVSTITQSSAAVVAVELVVHVGGQPSSDRPTDRGAGILVGGQQSIAARRQTAVVAHLGERRQTSFSTTRHSWRRDSVSIRRLHARPQSRQAEASLAVNHGGVTVVATAGVRLTSIVKPSTFEYVRLPIQLHVIETMRLSCTVIETAMQLFVKSRRF